MAESRIRPGPETPLSLSDVRGAGIPGGAAVVGPDMDGDAGPPDV
jgi:hypothetical protein